MSNPKLRFKRADGTEHPEWRKEKWSNLGSFVGSGTLSKSDLAEEGTPCILYGELYTKYGEIAHTIYSKTSATSHVFSQTDDVILPKSGETSEDISTATCIPYDGVSLGGDLIVFRHNEKMIGTFLSYLISNRAKRAISSIAQGKSVVHINEKALSNIELPYPQIEEQQKIADFLSTVDEVIAQSEAEVQNLEQQKKAAMQKIFSQEVRFKREDGTDYPEWRGTSFGETCSGFEYGMNTAACDYDGVNKYIRITDIDDTSRRYLSENAVSPKGNMQDKYIVNPNDILFARTGASVGKAYLYKDADGLLYYAGFLIRANVNADANAYFVFSQTLTADYWNWVKLTSMRTGQQGINAQEYKEYKFNVPCLEEQQKIADFLSAYDEAISYAKQELDKWKELKKGLLQQMFV